MGIREQILFNKERFYGGVDLGTEFMHTSDSVPAATNALVFMPVSINEGWKVPVGYFLIKGLTARERANLLSSRGGWCRGAQEHVSPQNYNVYKHTGHHI